MSRRLILLGCLAIGVSACKNLSGVDRTSDTPTQDLDVPYITTPDNVVMTILNIAGVTAKDFVLDLGSGDGRIPITAAVRFGAKGLGVEIDPSLVEASKVNAKLAKVEQLVDFKVQDLFETDLTQASVITMYLLPDVNLKLKPALQKLKPGTRIVSHDWDMGDWQPDRTEVVAAPDKKVGLIKQSKIMLWVVK
jgi:tRNA G37 N-methylase Trm5